MESVFHAPAGLGGGVVALTLVAAVLHAVWNAVAHGIADRLTGFALIGIAYLIGGGAAAAFLGPPPGHAWPYIAASVVLHTVYTLLLWASYELGDFSQAYPVARGTAPWAVAVIELGLGHRMPVVQVGGIVVISAGLLSLALGGDRPARASLPALAAAAATGLAIAGYTVVDASAVSNTPVPVYAAWMFLLQSPFLPVIALVRRRRALTRQPWTVFAGGLAGGFISLVAYVLVLVAQTSGATAAIAALRETSIVFGAVIGAVFLRERLGLRRVVAAAVVSAGIVLVSL